MNSNMDGALRVKRLRWMNRRGMRELEILLERFLDRETPALIAGGWPQLEALLDCEDDRLWDWFQGRLDDESAPFDELIHAIRKEPAVRD